MNLRTVLEFDDYEPPRKERRNVDIIIHMHSIT